MACPGFQGGVAVVAECHTRARRASCVRGPGHAPPEKFDFFNA